MAARNGHLDVVAVLAAQGADVNSRTERQETALISAAIWGQSAMCSQLLSDPAATNRFGKTALDKAREEGEAECVAALDPAAGVQVETMAVVTDAGAAPRAALRL
jgi:ankyrin repeat domain-containing protein 17